MAVRVMLFVVWCTICTIVLGAEDSFMIPAWREPGDKAMMDSISPIRRRQSGNVSSQIGASLYWFGEFYVGDSGPLKLLIDTGSTDCLINPGLYKPSKFAKPYAAKNFTIMYEGVNRQGFGFETITGTIKRDIVTAGGLTVPNLPVGNITNFYYNDTKPLPFANPGQGIIGFLGTGSSSFRPPTPSWAFRLCRDGALSKCRFGLAFGTSGKGYTIVGKLAKKLFKGRLTVAPSITHPTAGFTVLGDVAIGDKILFKNQTIIMDVGTNNIQAPLEVSEKIFKMLGYQTVLRKGGPDPFNPSIRLKVLQAFFPCDKPPTLGFSFPAESVLNGSGRGVSKKAKLFNVSPDVWDVYDHGNNNCTSILGGTNALTVGHSTAWLLGQPFFAGHYIDFHIAGTTGFANLKDPVAAKA